ncbi:MAG: ornithine cyclodeaminase family protein [Dehalococcoidia bacterium]|nr:ornithine cyclodeaminase family protein [Dehalococcoidia bacterium]
MPTLLLNKNTVKELLDMSEVIEAVEQAFRDWVEGRGRMPPKSYILLEKGDFRAMPAALPGAVGIKWVSVHPQNPSRGLPTVMATLVINDPDTGYPLAIMDGTDITAYRTGATAAVASRYLARKGSRSLGIIGAGRQAYTQIEAHVKLFDLREIRAFDLSKASVERLIKAFPGYPVEESSLEKAAGSDIVCTVTPARWPFVKREWIAPGVHINAIGADAPGKEELEPSVLNGAVVVVDDLEQSRTSGEINVPVSKGLFSMKEVYGTLGEIISGRKPGRRDDKAITVFDSTGVAIEDIAVAQVIYEKAKHRGGCPSMNLIE